ncbi:MAG: hypothetical protein Q8O14_00870 [bacterium]|nr:hypothetical protein [bacterium]
MTPRTNILATKDGVEALVALLLLNGSMCPECGHGTRATSKRWARCKACGARVARHNTQALVDKP